MLDIVVIRCIAHVLKRPLLSRTQRALTATKGVHFLGFAICCMSNSGLGFRWATRNMICEKKDYEMT